MPLEASTSDILLVTAKKAEKLTPIPPDVLTGYPPGSHQNRNSLADEITVDVNAFSINSPSNAMLKGRDSVSNSYEC